MSFPIGDVAMRMAGLDRHSEPLCLARDIPDKRRGANRFFASIGVAKEVLAALRACDPEAGTGPEKKAVRAAVEKIEGIVLIASMNREPYLGSGRLR
jgi:hypothetical protein